MLIGLCRGLNENTQVWKGCFTQGPAHSMCSMNIGYHCDYWPYFKSLLPYIGHIWRFKLPSSCCWWVWGVGPHRGGAILALPAAVPGGVRQMDEGQDRHEAGPWLSFTQFCRSPAAVQSCLGPRSSALARPSLGPSSHQAPARGCDDLRLVLDQLLSRRDQYGLLPALHATEGVRRALGAGRRAGGRGVGSEGARAPCAAEEIEKFVCCTVRAAHLQCTQPFGAVMR